MDEVGGGIGGRQAGAAVWVIWAGQQLNDVGLVDRGVVRREPRSQWIEIGCKLEVWVEGGLGEHLHRPVLRNSYLRQCPHGRVNQLNAAAGKDQSEEKTRPAINTGERVTYM